MRTIGELLDMPNVRVTKYQTQGHHRVNVFIESTISAAVCPDCESVCAKLHAVDEAQMIRDLPMWHRRCWIGYAPRRFTCEPCHKTFVERVAWREPGLNYTTRYEEYVYEQVRRESVAQVAKDEGLSEDTLAGIFARRAKKR
ncbi:MAG: transposase family protein [Chloroflexi bacterium]|nr:transposase family protein [Chloroflexota bacterium]